MDREDSTGVFWYKNRSIFNRKVKDWIAATSQEVLQLPPIYFDAALQSMNYRSWYASFHFRMNRSSTRCNKSSPPIS